MVNGRTTKASTKKASPLALLLEETESKAKDAAIDNDNTRPIRWGSHLPCTLPPPALRAPALRAPAPSRASDEAKDSWLLSLNTALPCL